MSRKVEPSTRIMLENAWTDPVQWRGQSLVSVSANDQRLKYGSHVMSGTAGGRSAGWADASDPRSSDSTNARTIMALCRIVMWTGLSRCNILIFRANTARSGYRAVAQFDRAVQSEPPLVFTP